MINYDKKYQKIIDDLIEKSFPEFAGKGIRVSAANERVSGRCSAVTYYFIWISFIKVSRRVRKFSDLELKGLLAHELGHILRFESCNFFGKFWEGLKYFISRKARTIEENICDKIAIERGYAKGLFSFKSKSKKKTKYSECYLSANDVKTYAKEIGKW